MERAEKEEVVMEKSEDIVNNIERLPEGCISDILSLTSPADVCRSSLLSTLLKSAADSDALWEKFLPPDYEKTISRASNPISLAALSKKELYYRLSDDPLLIDGGLKSFQLKKCGAKKCIMLGAKELAIAWGHNPEHWLAKVAELKWVRWLEIRGKLDTRLLSPKTLYAAYLVLKLKAGAYGFRNQPVKARVEVVGREGGSSSMCSEERHIYLSTLNSGNGQYFSRERSDGWMEVEMGHFYNGEVVEGDDWEVHMSVLETERLGAKYGLVVQGMELRPKVDINHYNFQYL
ncbi:hypothetical protein MKW98_027173 [Papaver atlanticum]|uniref:F-box domain-containing protein n=1 Tax=Papaver atlanticum TaxID=357466 RepID=A0AAD4T3W6_9MAGN|nr:hypothetical protein MKW98_027173 [Papaver atlanticum]